MCEKRTAISFQLMAWDYDLEMAESRKLNAQRQAYAFMHFAPM